MRSLVATHQWKVRTHPAKTPPASTRPIETIILPQNSDDPGLAGSASTGALSRKYGVAKAARTRNISDAVCSLIFESERGLLRPRCCRCRGHQ